MEIIPDLNSLLRYSENYYLFIYKYVYTMNCKISKMYTYKYILAHKKNLYNTILKYYKTTYSRFNRVLFRNATGCIHLIGLSANTLKQFK